MKPTQNEDVGAAPLVEVEAVGERTGPGATALDSRERRRRQYRLNQLMMMSVVFAILFFFVGQAVRTGKFEDALLAVVAFSFVSLALGVWSLQRFTKSGFAGWTLVLFGLTGLFGIALTWFSFPFIVLCLISVSHVVSRYRTMQQDSLLWAMALAADRSMPMGPSLRAFSNSLGGAYRKRALQLAECVDNGMPLPDAMEFVHTAASPPAIVLARVGWDAGALPEALRTAASERITERGAARSFAGKIAYLSMMLVAIQTVIIFLMYFIMPKFEAIFRDFGIPLPPLTIIVIRVSYLFGAFGIGPLLLLLEIVLLIYLPYAVSGWGNLSIPFIDRFFARRHRLLILKSIAIVVERSQPVALAVLSLSRSYPTRWVRRRLVAAWRGIEAGIGWADALRGVGLLTETDAEVLIAAERLGNLGWAFQELARSGERRYLQRLDVVSQLLFSLVLIGAGMLVGMLCLAYFLPLIQLISMLAG